MITKMTTMMKTRHMMLQRITGEITTDTAKGIDKHSEYGTVVSFNQSDSMST